MSTLRENYCGADLAPDLFRRLMDPLEREALRALLLGRYFDEPTRATLLQRMTWNRNAELYARQLLHPTAD